MSEIEAAKAAEPSAGDDTSKTGDVEKSEEPQPQANNGEAAKEVSYIPQSEEEYNVTFKTWIVVWVSSLCIPIAVNSKWS